MGVNRGKQFEEIIRKDFEKVVDTTVIRLPDPVQGYLGYRNICDFIVYHYPNQYFIECKSIKGTRFPLSNISKNQYTGLLEMSEVYGVRAGILVWFIEKDVTLFVDIRLIKQLKDKGCKSIKFDFYTWDSRYILVNGKKKRIFFEYDMKNFFEVADERYKKMPTVRHSGR